MRKHSARTAFACATVLGIVVSTLARPAPAAEAQGADKTSCADAYKGAQVQRKSGALRRARESLLVCVSDRCPAVLQPDCTRWLTEVEAALPSLAFAAKGPDGRDLSAVKVSLDGQVLTEALDGKAVPVDPGSHTLRFETAGETPIEQPIVVREGEKARVVGVSWAREPAPDAARAEGPPAGRPSAPAAAWALGGLGVASLATFGALAIHGTMRRSDLKASCYGHCSSDDVSSVKTELAVADVALGVGIVSTAVSAVLFLAGRGPERSAPVAVGVAPLRGGGAVGLGGVF